MEYEFRFVVNGATVDNADIVELLAENFDAMLFRGGGIDLLDIAYEGRDAFDAAISAARELSSRFPNLHLRYLHRDLVGIPEIAERTNTTRQAVALWVNGHRRNDTHSFPSPEGISGRTRVWLWPEVNTWLKQYGLDDRTHRPDRMEMADIDSALHRGLHLRSTASIERWRPTRKMGMTASYVHLAPLWDLSREDEDVAEDSPKGWQHLQSVRDVASTQ